MNSVQSTGHTGSMSKKDSQIEVKKKKNRFFLFLRLDKKVGHITYYPEGLYLALNCMGSLAKGVT